MFEVPNLATLMLYIGTFIFFASFFWIAELLKEPEIIIKKQIAFFDWMDIEELIYFYNYI